MFKGIINKWNIFVLFSIYLLISLPVGFAFQCEEFKSEEIGGIPIIEYCKKPSKKIKENEGENVFFIYVYVADEDFININYYNTFRNGIFRNGIDAGCDTIVNLQKEIGANLDRENKRLTFFGNGAFALKCLGENLEIKPADIGSNLRIQGHKNCDAFVVDRADTERFIDYISFQDSDKPIEKDIDEINKSLNYISSMNNALIGGSAVFLLSCNIPGAPGGGGPPTEGLCRDCEGNIEYPSFRIILNPTPEEIEKYKLGESKKNGKIIQRQLIEITREGPLKGERFVFDRLVTSTPVQKSFTDKLYTLDSPIKNEIGTRTYHFHPSTGEGSMSAIVIREDFRGKGLARIFNERAVAELLSLGAEKIKVRLVMAIGEGMEEVANPYIAKTWKNLKFGPDPSPAESMAELIEMSKFDDPPVSSADIMQAKNYPDYWFVYLQFKEPEPYGAPRGLILFVEDEEGNFIKGKEFYEDNFLGKTERQVKDFIKTLENEGRTLWGQIPYEAKDMDFLKTEILDKIIVPRCVCDLPGKTAYYPGSGGDISIFKHFPDIDSAVFVDIWGIYSTPEGIEMMIRANAVMNKMEIENLEVNEIGVGKFKVTFRYNGKNKNIIFYNKDANTFFPRELEKGYDLYFEKLLIDFYDMQPETKVKVIKYLKKDGNYAVFTRWDYISYKHELLPSLLGLEETSRFNEINGWKGHFCKKIKDMDEDLLLRILKEIYPDAENAYRARAGMLHNTVDKNVDAFDGYLKSIESKLDKFSEDGRKFIMDSLKKDIIDGGPTPEEIVRFPPSEIDRLFLETLNKFCEFQKRVGVESVCKLGGCLRTKEPLTRDSFRVIINGEETGNLIKVTEEVIKKVNDMMKSEGISGEIGIMYTGSAQFFYHQKGGKYVIDFEHISDVDYYLIFSEDVPKSEYGHIRDELLGDKLKEGVETLFKGRDIVPTELTSGTIEKIIKHELDLDFYVRGPYSGVYIGSSAMMEEIEKNIDKVKVTSKMIAEEFRDHYGRAIEFAHDGNYEKALKRLIKSVDILNDKELVSEMVDAYGENYPDLEGVWNKYKPIVEKKFNALEIRTKLNKIDMRIKYSDEINKEVIEILREQYILEKVDKDKLKDVDKKLDDILNRLRKDLPEKKDRAALENVIRYNIKRFIDYMKKYPKIKDYIEVTADEVAEERAKMFRMMYEKFMKQYNDDYYELLKFGKNIKTEFDGAGLDIKDFPEIQKAEEKYVDAIEKNMESADKLNKWHESSYSKYVYRIKDKEFKKLKDIGRSKYAKYGDIPVFVLAVLSMEVGERLMRVGYAEKDIYLVKIGFAIYIGGLIPTLDIGMSFLLAIISAIASLALGELIKISIGAIICYLAVKLIIEFADYLICELDWSKSADIGTYSIYELFCGPTMLPIVHIELIDKSGKTMCKYAGGWAGQREIYC